MNHPFFDVLQTVRLFAYAFDLVDLDVSSLQQANGSPVAWIPKRVSALCLRVEFVFGHYVAICFDTRSPSRPAMAMSYDVELLSGVLVNPVLIKPFSGVGIVGCKEVEFLGVDPDRMAEWDYVSGQQKIEWFNLL